MLWSNVDEIKMVACCFGYDV